MEIHGPISPIPTFTDAYSVTWPNSHVISGPPPTPSAYFYTDFQVQQRYNGQHTVESPPPHCVPTASVRDRPFSHYGIGQPEVARYPESSQRTALDETTTSYFKSGSSEFPPNRLRRLTRSDANRRGGDILNEDSIACESPAADRESDNFPPEGHVSRFSSRRSTPPTPQVPFSSPTMFLPCGPFSYEQFYSDSPHRPIDPSPVDIPSAHAFVDPVEPTTVEFDPGILPLVNTRPSTPSPLHGDQNSRPVFLSLQMRPLPLAPLDDADAHQPVPSFNRSNDEIRRYHSSNGDTEYKCNSVHPTPSPPLPPLPTPGLRTRWSESSESSLSIAFNEETFSSVAHSESNSPPPSHSGSESSALSSDSQSSRHSTPVVGPDTHPTTLTTTSTPRRRVKKKCKMHECNICHKQFPRPSGLSTHQNSHSGKRPYKCNFPHCNKSFAVRSNARRHLRTHGIFPAPEQVVPGPCFAGFNPPIVSDSSHQLVRVTTKLKWIPQSLSTRTNAALLESELDEKNGGCSYSPSSLGPPLSSPLPPVLPSFPALHFGDEFEERNSLAEAGPQPYHPVQWRVLPGPALGLRTTQAAV